MKKLFISTLFLINLMGIIPVVNAQDFALTRSNIVAVNPYPETSKKLVSEIDVNINAARDFRKSFRNATDVKWVQNENGSSVYFTNDGTKMRASYNQKGKKEYMLSYYDESKMSSDLRQRVKSNYYDHSIAIVTEVNRNNQTYFLVKMENDKEFLTLKVDDEEMSVFEKTNKIK